MTEHGIKTRPGPAGEIRPILGKSLEITVSDGQKEEDKQAIAV